MKKLLSSKLVLFLMATISIVCFAFGIILTTSRNVQADNSTPDFTTWNKRVVQVGDDLTGKYIAIKDLPFYGVDGDSHDYYNQVHMVFSVNDANLYFLYIEKDTPSPLFLDNSSLGISMQYLDILNIDSVKSDGFYVVKLDPLGDVDTFVVSEICFSTYKGESLAVDTYFILEEPIEPEEPFDTTGLLEYDEYVVGGNYFRITVSDFNLYSLVDDDIILNLWRMDSGHVIFSGSSDSAYRVDESCIEYKSNNNYFDVYLSKSITLVHKETNEKINYNLNNVVFTADFPSLSGSIYLIEEPASTCPELYSQVGLEPVGAIKVVKHSKYFTWEKTVLQRGDDIINKYVAFPLRQEGWKEVITFFNWGAENGSTIKLRYSNNPVDVSLNFYPCECSSEVSFTCLNNDTAQADGFYLFNIPQVLTCPNEACANYGKDLEKPVTIYSLAQCIYLESNVNESTADPFLENIYFLENPEETPEDNSNNTNDNNFDNISSDNLNENKLLKIISLSSVIVLIGFVIYFVYKKKVLRK